MRLVKLLIVILICLTAPVHADGGNRDRKLVIYDVTAPDGTQYKVEAPDDATQAEVVDILLDRLVEEDAAEREQERLASEAEYLESISGFTAPKQKSFIERVLDNQGDAAHRKCMNRANNLYQDRLQSAIADPLTWQLAGFESASDMARTSRRLAMAKCIK